MISGNREQLWFDWQIGSVRVSRIASVCRELDTASCLPASTLEIMTFTSDSLSRVEISQSHVTNVSQFFFFLFLKPTSRAIEQTLDNHSRSYPEENEIPVLRASWKVQKSFRSNTYTTGLHFLLRCSRLCLSPCLSNALL